MPGLRVSTSLHSVQWDWQTIRRWRTHVHDLLPSMIQMEPATIYGHACCSLSFKCDTFPALLWIIHAQGRVLICICRIQAYTFYCWCLISRIG
jgi:hypothetical protein